MTDLRPDEIAFWERVCLAQTGCDKGFQNHPEVNADRLVEHRRRRIEAYKNRPAPEPYRGATSGFDLHELPSDGVPTEAAHTARCIEYAEAGSPWPNRVPCVC